MVFVQCLALAHSLIKERQADFTGADDSHDLFQPRHLSGIGSFVPQHPHMVGQTPSIGVVSPFTQKVEHLRESEGNQKVVGGVRIADKKEQRRFFVPQLIQLQLVIRHDLPELGNIKGSQPCTAANQNTFCCLAAGELVFLILPHGEVLGAAAFQPVKHIVHRVFEGFVILPDFHAVYHFHQRIHVAFFLRPLKDDVGHKGAVQEGFCFCPELVALLAVAFGVGNQGGNKFQNIAFCLDIGQRIVVHGF